MKWEKANNKWQIMEKTALVLSRILESVFKLSMIRFMKHGKCVAFPRLDVEIEDLEERQLEVTVRYLKRSRRSKKNFCTSRYFPILLEKPRETLQVLAAIPRQDYPGDPNRRLSKGWRYMVQA